MSTETYTPTEVPIKEIFTNGNVRPNGDKGQFEALRNNIEEVGQIVPITVYHEDKKYWVLTGHQRLRALKNLSKDTVKISVVDKPENSNHSLIQYSENMFRVEMSLYDQVQGMKKISTENPDLTYEQLSARFGKNVKWVSSRMAIANLVKALYNKNFINSEDIEDLVMIGGYSHEIQTEAINQYCHIQGGISMTQFHDEIVNDDMRIFLLTRLLHRSYLTEAEMSKLFSEEELDEYWTTYKHKKESTNLFDETTIQYDLGFFVHCVNMTYPDRLAELNAIPIKRDLRSWDPMVKEPTLHNIFTVKSKTLEKYVSWNGDWKELMFEVNSKAPAKSSIDDEEVVEEKTKFHGCGTKLARAIIPEYYKYVTNEVIYNESSIEWLRSLSEWDNNLSNINHWFKTEALPAYGYSELGSVFLDEHISYCIEQSTIKELDSFAQLHNKLGIKDWINDQFKLLTKNEPRESILSAFKVDHLKTAYNGEGSTKSDLVKSIANKECTFKFNAIFKDKGANFWEQNCRVHLTE